MHDKTGFREQLQMTAEERGRKEKEGLPSLAVADSGSLDLSATQPEM